MLKDLFSKLNKKVNETNRNDGTFENSESIMTKCPNCKKILYSKELYKRLNVCTNCEYHLPITAPDRMEHSWMKARSNRSWKISHRPIP